MAALVFIALIPMIIGHFWLIALAFRESVLWGILCLFVPLATVAFAATNWQVAKKACLVYLSGVGLVVVAGIVAGIVVPLGKKPAAQVAQTESVAPAPAPVTYDALPAYTPPPPPKPAPVTATEPEVRMIEQVYVVNATNLYYSAKCRKLPENAYRVAKSVAVRQGFTAAACP
ncbi:MAG TPA: hypothetical protein VN181_10605 [Thermoanaerobaculia bacterium]|nr:hypothetical protein [Thermoanaerobaculia bacterium]